MDLATPLNLARIGLGAVAWTAPRLATAAMGLDPTDRKAPFLLRLFGSRDLAMGVATLVVPAPARPALLGIGAAVDASDAAAALLALRADGLRPVPATLVAATATAAAATGLVALRQRLKA